MISKKTKYGLKAMFYLSRHADEGPLLISDIAEEENIPRKFLELILLELKRNGLLQSKMGKGGGYMLSKSPTKITVGQIVRILDGPLAPISCVSKTAYQRCDECVSERNCEIRKIMMQVREATSKILDTTSLEDAKHSFFEISKIK
ncbi:MAG: Rrf2 family transcriptional regulator [Chitinophagales bacterium]|nr:Rrf2 family transcriptional regulator [Chitinophagales bacterium]